jgi:hypothetical protein
VASGREKILCAYANATERDTRGQHNGIQESDFSHVSTVSNVSTASQALRARCERHKTRFS